MSRCCIHEVEFYSEDNAYVTARYLTSERFSWNRTEMDIRFSCLTSGTRCLFGLLLSEFVIHKQDVQNHPNPNLTQRRRQMQETPFSQVRLSSIVARMLRKLGSQCTRQDLWCKNTVRACHFTFQMSSQWLLVASSWMCR